MIVIGLASFVVGAVYAGSEYNNVYKQADSKYPPVSDKVIEAANNEITLFDEKINLSIAQGNSLSSALTSEEAAKFNQDEQIVTKNTLRDKYIDQLSEGPDNEKPAAFGMLLGPILIAGGVVTALTKRKS